MKYYLLKGVAFTHLVKVKALCVPVQGLGQHPKHSVPPDQRNYGKLSSSVGFSYIIPRSPLFLGTLCMPISSSVALVWILPKWLLLVFGSGNQSTRSRWSRRLPPQCSHGGGTAICWFGFCTTRWAETERGRSGNDLRRKADDRILPDWSTVFPEAEEQNLIEISVLRHCGWNRSIFKLFQAEMETRKMVMGGHCVEIVAQDSLVQRLVNSSLFITRSICQSTMVFEQFHLK
jgi:hypothetical protein